MDSLFVRRVVLAATLAGLSSAVVAQMEDVLFRWKITGHYRYFGP